MAEQIENSEGAEPMLAITPDAFEMFRKLLVVIADERTCRRRGDCGRSRQARSRPQLAFRAKAAACTR